MGDADGNLQIGTTTAPAAPAIRPASRPPTPIQHTVTLTWQASSSANVTGYNVYRSTISGGYYGLVGSAAESLSYADQTVESGTTYYYVTTAVNAEGEESALLESGRYRRCHLREKTARCGIGPPAEPVSAARAYEVLFMSLEVPTAAGT